ncbi:polysaccharide deacetylase family protein [Acinetobacter qingfengensis]|uniref:Polysaccharide deacetylase n=1 Tax=Acinetobacter qingfengensis TaxID=1262585 RepID=A0A1E7QYZ8_9GAMM|nr:polysaccharide deacetylase family protein [Acinetobacter qingfengensis]KAA8733137.1 polysaccharide deacetylase family protein [Acinetobacter qingfengensis]OEY92287.1 polysaccharide deacetylase [Acinetobacter qingfengensis]
MYNWVLLLILSFSVTSVSAKQLALSFDDGLNPEVEPQAAQINHDILTTLHQNQIKAILFPSLSKIGDQQGLTLVSEWGKQGHRIGNHSDLHQNLNHDDVTLAAYLASMQRGDSQFKSLQGFVQRYRFPFLKEGNTQQKRDGVRQWLDQHHYQSGAVSIDASDWYYNQLFVKYQKEQDQARLEKLKQAYINHLLDRASYYDDLALKTLQRSPKHVLLLHVRAINAAWLGDVITAFRQHGWQFIDSDTAYQDPIYKIQLNILPAGESILWQIAKVYGIENLRYPAEDVPYEQENLRRFSLSSTKL